MSGLFINIELTTIIVAIVAVEIRFKAGLKKACTLASLIDLFLISSAISTASELVLSSKPKDLIVLLPLIHSLIQLT